MSVELDAALRGKGTRFRLFPQSPVLKAFREPELVWVSTPPGRIRPGPADERMYVVDAVGKRDPYEWPPNAPPYRGERNPPAAPGADGHFDRLEPDSRAFMAAHVYGALHRVLDIWDDYCGHRIPWHFHDDYPRLEIIPLIEWDNAQSGYGFIETGYGDSAQGRQPYCLNFDVIAHELGHSIVFSEVGVPSEVTFTNAYSGFHESAGDLVALISVLHFAAFVEHLLATTRGNLYALNELNRIGELSETEQIRLASNSLKMADVAYGERQLSQPELHRLGQPLTGALFDILVEVFQARLVENGLISSELDTLSRRIQDTGVDNNRVQAEFDRVYRGNEQAFRDALLEARDFLGRRLARTWRRLSPHWLNFAGVATKFMSADRALSGQRYQTIIRDCFLWRRIGYGCTGGAVHFVTR